MNYIVTNSVTGTILGSYLKPPLSVAKFNGGSSYINLGTANTLDLDTSSFTVSAWINPARHVLSSTRFGVIGTYSPGWYLGIYASAGAESYRFYNGSTYCTFTPTGSLIFLNWTHLAVTRNTISNSVILYVNGTAKATCAQNVVVASANPVDLGKTPNGYYFNGTIADVQVYNTVLSSTSISSLYSAGITGTPIAGANNVGWWPLNSDAIDDSGMGNNGAMTSTTFTGFQNINGTSSTLPVGSVNAVYGSIALAQQPSISGGFSYSAWFNRNSDNNYQYLFYNNQFFIRVDGYSENANQPIDAFIRLSDGSAEPRAELVSQVTKPYTWYFVTTTWNGVKLNLYINGILTASSTRSGTMNAMPTTATMGNQNPTTYTAYNGLLADVQIYNSVLTSSAINALYAKGISGSPVDSANTIGWYPLSGDSNDDSGMGNNGAANNILYKNIMITSNTFLLQIPSAWAGNTIQFNAIVTDSATQAIPANSAKSAAITVH